MSANKQPSIRLDGITGRAEQMALQIHSLIRSGALRPGDPVREQALADRFGASRGPVREALRFLTARGVLTTEPNKGCRVAKPAPKQIHEISEIGNALLCLAARMAARNVLPATATPILAEAQKLVSIAETDIDPLEFLNCNWRCIEAIVEAADAPTLHKMMEEHFVLGPVGPYMALILTTPVQRREYAALYHDVAKLVVEGKAAEAEDVIAKIHNTTSQAITATVTAGMRLFA